MSAAFTPTPMRISVERYQKMIAAGVLTQDDRVELIEGEMLDRAPVGAKHAAMTARLARLFNLAVSDVAVVSPGGPVHLGDYSETQPDVSLLKFRADYYGAKIPESEDVFLLIEVSDSTVTFDQSIKRDLYARYGIAEYWVVDVNDYRITTYREPTPKGYSHTCEFAAATDTLSPQAFPDLKITIRELSG
jgi:Uma2 family endonuclease